MIRHFLLTILLGGCLVTLLPAQQLPNLALFRDNWNVLNPGSMSSDYIFGDRTMSLFTSYRDQWSGFEGAPWTGLLNWEYVIDNYNVTTGGYFIHDQTGEIGYSGLYGRFAYRLDLDRRGDHWINVGINAGVVQYRAKIANIEFEEEELFMGDDQVYYPDFGMGVMYYNEDKYYLGFSIPQTFGLSPRFRSDDGELTLDRVQHFYVMGGTYFDVYLFNSDASFLEASGFVRYVPNTPLSVDAHLRCQFTDVFWAGLGGSTAKTMRADVGVVIGESVNFTAGQIKLAFSYGIGLGPFASALGNSLEFHAAYSWYTY